MPDTYSSNLRVLLMADGGDNNTWGANTNTNLGLFEDAITKRADISIGGLGTGTQQFTPTSANGASDNTRVLSYSATGALNGNVQVIVPNIPKLYVFDNKTTGAFTVTLQTATPSSILTCAQGIATMCYVDGQNNVKAVQAFGQGAALNVSQSWTAGQAVTPLAFSEGTPTTLDASLSNNFYGTLTASRTFAITNIKDGEELNVVIKQGGAGSFIPTFPANVVWPNGITPTFSTAVGASDKVRLQYFQTLNLYFGEALINYNPVASPAFAVTLQTQDNVSLFELLGSPVAAIVANVTVPAGVTIRSNSNVDPSLDLSGFTAGSTINLFNLGGSIIGKGGDGSHGGSLSGSAAAGIQEFKWPNDAQAGGDAIKAPGAGITFNVTNATGFIFGGGGGGGGGGFQAAAGGVNQDVGGGGGGGGAGGGRRGEGGVVSNVAATLPGTKLKGGNGADGGYMHTSTFGAGGTAATAESPTAGYNGGNGGAFGAAGADGAGTTTYSGAGGAAGKAINLNGGAVVFISGNDATHVKGAVV